MALTVTVKARGPKPAKGRFPITVKLGLITPTLADLKEAIAAESSLGIHRQRLTTLDKKLLAEDRKTLSELGIKDGDVIELKDLGAQVAWRTVFLIEYFGPLFIHPFFYHYQKLVYGRDFAHSRMQQVALVLVLAHYVKRELETLFVHRFSSATMPWFNIIKNSGHYWGLSGLLLAVPLYAPSNGAKALYDTIQDKDAWLFGWSALWAFAEFSNLLTHLNLSSLRPSGTTIRQIPKGYGFNLVSCANYWFETVAWVAFCGLTLNWAAGVFTAVAVAQMYVWAVKKHRRYKKEFGDKYPRGRKVMFPFIA